MSDLISKIYDEREFFLIAGPCVIENAEHTYRVAKMLKELCEDNGLPFVFKSSYDKANRTSIESFRGPGLIEGLKILSSIKNELDITITTDVHSVQDIEKAADVVDILQIPAFLCRQTDLLVAAGRTGRAVNVKKGQFMAPWDMKNVVEKVLATGNKRVMVTERGSMYGYNNLVVDMRSLVIMQELSVPVVFDATHSVQIPGGQGKCSGGKREFVWPLAKAALAVGVNGIFMEVHENPDQALCDGPNSMPLAIMDKVIHQIRKLSSMDWGKIDVS
ncbi:MAG TPA: 3-deoxy-8-phosphooctulonate synthase [Deltaproteobacteria bacterium]|nr:MAG: 3-deoxy-8-phosphooctulonate synthase [Deltaproteobacteria bacterium]HDM77833.1 3-deoxy-8-phosphooctulonate synthase [Deltaproteobacteria bacterium]